MWWLSGQGRVGWRHLTATLFLQRGKREIGRRGEGGGLGKRGLRSGECRGTDRDVRTRIPVGYRASGKGRVKEERDRIAKHLLGGVDPLSLRNIG